MSISTIDSSKTTQYQFNESVIAYKNPAISIHVLSDGRVWNPSKEKFIKESVGLYDAYYIKDGKQTKLSMQSILSRFFGIKKTLSTIIVPIDKNLGYAKGNLKLIDNPNRLGRKNGSGTVNKTPSKKLADYVKVPTVTYNASKEVLLENSVRLIPNDVEHRFVCSDFSHYSNEKDAKEHQANVLFAKSCAEAIIAKNAGYALAEEIFLMNMNYGINNRPYSNFKDMIKNENSEIVEEGSSNSYKFASTNFFDEAPTIKEIVLSKDFSCTLKDAKKICHEVKKINESILIVIDLASST